MERIRFGILGCGNIAARFARALKSSKDGVLYACAARDLARAEAFAAKHGPSHGEGSTEAAGSREVGQREVAASSERCQSSAVVAYGDYESLIKDPKVDAIYIATIHPAHAALAKACIEAGKPVICEKPFFTGVEEAKEVIALAREKNVLIMEAFWTRCAPCFAKVKEWIDTGRIGDVHLIRAAFCYAYPLNEQTLESRVWDPKKGGGAVLDIGVYTYEYVTGLLGVPEKVTYDVHYASTGVDATVSMNMIYPRAIASTVCSVEAAMDDTAIISGETGFIKQDRFYGSRRCELYSNRGELLEVFEDPQEEGFVHEIDHFTSLIREGKKESDLIPLSDNLDFITVAEPIWKHFEG